jgi:hypothetical protein
MKGKTAKSEAKEAPSNGKSIIKPVFDGKIVRKAKGGKAGCYAAGGAVGTAKGMGAAVKGGKFHEA